MEAYMTQETIKKPIEEKAIILFVYDSRRRVIEPHDLGIIGVVIQTLGYQVEGSNSSGRLSEWRRFDLEKIVGMQVTAQTLSGRKPFPSGRHSSWDQQILIVDV
jgi:hypothetical protein